MEHKKTQSQPIVVTVDITCDCCGKSCKEPNGEPHQLEYMTLKANWGYYSNKDLQSWVAHVCESCVDNLFTFVKFQKTNSINARPLKDE